MKKTIISVALMLLCAFTTVSAQDYTQQGTVFVESKTKTSKNSSIETKYTWQDKEGTSYKIYLSKNGRAFVKKVSKKTGNEYNKYLDEEISEKLSKEYNITYTPKTSK